MKALPPDDPERATSALVRTTARPVEVLPEHEDRQRRGFFRAVGALLGLCKDYTVTDLRRLKEAKLRQQEALADTEEAQAQAKVAEAAERQAEAARKAAEAELLRSHAVRELADATKTLAEAKVIDPAAIERFRKAVSMIRQAGGDVAFEHRRLEELAVVSIHGEIKAPAAQAAAKGKVLTDPGAEHEHPEHEGSDG